MTIPTTKSQAARDVADMLEKHPEGMTSRALWESYKSLLSDAGCHEEAEGIKYITSALRPRVEQGLVEAKENPDGKGYIYYPTITAGQAQTKEIIQDITEHATMAEKSVITPFPAQEATALLESLKAAIMKIPNRPPLEKASERANLLLELAPMVNAEHSENIKIVANYLMRGD